MATIEPANLYLQGPRGKFALVIFDWTKLETEGRWSAEQKINYIRNSEILAEAEKTETIQDINTKALR